MGSIDETPTITFTKDNVVGKLYYEDGKFHFSGDAGQSAKLFLESLNKECENGEWITCRSEDIFDIAESRRQRMNDHLSNATANHMRKNDL